MWFGRQKSATSPQDSAIKVETLIGQNTEIVGDVLFSGGLHVEGCVKGHVLADTNQPSRLTLHSKGRIEGEVRVKQAVIDGVVLGDIYAEERIELEKHAQVNGHIHYRVIDIAAGSEVNGSLLRLSSQALVPSSHPPAEERPHAEEDTDASPDSAVHEVP